MAKPQTSKKNPKQPILTRATGEKQVTPLTETRSCRFGIVPIATMRISFTPFLILSPSLWDDLSRTLLDATEGHASNLRYVASRDAVTDTPSSIEVVRTPLTGDADYEIEVHWKNRCRLGDDAVAYRIAGALSTPVIVPNRDVEPNDWLLVTHDGEIYTPITLDVELMERDRCVAYKRA